MERGRIVATQEVEAKAPAEELSGKGGWDEVCMGGDGLNDTRHQVWADGQGVQRRQDPLPDLLLEHPLRVVILDRGEKGRQDVRVDAQDGSLDDLCLQIGSQWWGLGKGTDETGKQGVDHQGILWVVRQCLAQARGNSVRAEIRFIGKPAIGHGFHLVPVGVCDRSNGQRRELLARRKGELMHETV